LVSGEVSVFSTNVKTFCMKYFMVIARRENMNISNTIKEQRNRLSLSQDEQGERIYVSRQTISSWENDKTYPDVHSLVLLSQVFDMTIDNLIKGDIEIMEQKIEKNDIMDMNRYAYLMIALIGITVILLPLSLYLAFIPGIFIAALTLSAYFHFSHKVNKIKKQYDVQTYREIIAFTKGEMLDEISKIRESGKRKYQIFINFLGGLIFGAIVAIVTLWLLRGF